LTAIKSKGVLRRKIKLLIWSFSATSHRRAVRLISIALFRSGGRQSSLCVIYSL